MFLRNNKLIMLLMVTSLLLIISACSGDSNETSGDVDYSDETIESGADATPEKEQELISDALVDTDIWYRVRLGEGDVNNKGSYINSIYTFENDTVTRYGRLNDDVRHLDDLSGMSDEDILNHFKENNDSEQTFENESYYINLWTDDSGYNTRQIDINVDSQQHVNGSGYPELVFNYIVELDTLDEHFEGYVFDNMDHNENDSLIRRVDEKDLGGLKFDAPDTDKEIIKVDDK